MLRDQEFFPKRLVLIGHEFFASSGRSFDPLLAHSYARLPEEVHALFGLVFIGVEEAHTLQCLKALEDSPVRTEATELVSSVPNRKQWDRVRKWASLAELVYAPSVAALYAYSSQNCIGHLYTTEQVIDSMKEAAATSVSVDLLTILRR